MLDYNLLIAAIWLVLFAPLAVFIVRSSRVQYVNWEEYVTSEQYASEMKAMSARIELKV
jgi:hypothetical protein